MSNDYIPPKEKDFYEWQSLSIKYARDNRERFGIPESAMSPELYAKRDDYQAKYAIAENPETRTSAHVLARQESRKVYEVDIRAFFKGYVMYNKAVTDEDRRIMGLTVHDPKPTPVPPPPHAPGVITVTVADPAVLDIAFHDKKEEGHAKAYGIHGAEMAWGVFEAAAIAPVDWSELPHSTFATHSPLRLTFNGHDRGKAFYFALRWENTRGEKGPWSEIQSTIVP
jgi:hypothetical protein